MRKRIIRLLLSALNSRWLNSSPCEYGYIGNVEAFSIEHLRSEERQRPGITVGTIIREAEMFRACLIRKDGVLVLQDHCEPREATAWDLHELRQSMNPKRE